MKPDGLTAKSLVKISYEGSVANIEVKQNLARSIIIEVHKFRFYFTFRSIPDKDDNKTNTKEDEANNKNKNKIKIKITNR